MAHWAEIDENNIVTKVTVGSNEDPDEGYQWLVDNLGGTWVKTSYNSRNGRRVNPETNEETDEPGFRKNYAGIGFTYDSIRDAFIPPKPEMKHPSGAEIEFIFDEESCNWIRV
jgi:hypothetical protein